LFALGIPYVKTTLHASDSIFGALIALWGVGMALGAFAAQKFPLRESDLFRLGLGGAGAILIIMALIPHPWLALVVSVGFGSGLGRKPLRVPGRRRGAVRRRRGGQVRCTPDRGRNETRPRNRVWPVDLSRSRTCRRSDACRGWPFSCAVACACVLFSPSHKGS